MEDRTPDRNRGYRRVLHAGEGRPGGNSQLLVKNLQAYGGTYR